MIKILRFSNCSASLKQNINYFKRCFLSESFKCTDVWEKRLKSPILKKADHGNIYSELDKRSSIGYRINVLDFDIFANSMTNDDYQSQLEDILFKIRLNPETRIMYESTSHAIIRWYLSLGKKEELLNIMSQRLSYGLFPDVYLTILMMDQFLKENDVLSALKIAVLQMLQEDCDHPVLKTLAVHVCLKFLNSGIVWETPQEENVDVEEDVVRVRVPFVRNDYFDDHFDITNTNHLIGKTMIAYGKVLGGPIGLSSQLIGMIMYEKFDAAKVFLESNIKNKSPIFKEAVDKAKFYLKNEAKTNVEEDSGKKTETENEAVSSMKMEIENLLSSIGNENLLGGSLELESEKITRADIVKQENHLIENQCMIYEQWEKEREENFKSELKDIEKNETMMEIENVKEQLALEEQHIFYFDHEFEYDYVVERNIKQKQDVYFYKPKKREQKKLDVAYPSETTSEYAKA